MKLNIEGVKGCTDHGCVFGHPGGMGTNGGCHCLEMRPTAERLRVERNVRLLIRAIQDLRNELTAARLERDNLRKLIDRALEWEPVFPLEAGLIDEMWEAIGKEKPRSLAEHPSGDSI